MQFVVLEQETDDSLASTAPAGLTGLCTVQVEPFQTSASVTAFFPFDLAPTATQSESVGHETLPRLGARTLAGSVSTVQVAPFHFSAPTVPTASHSEVRGHATAARSLLAGDGVASCVHRDPSHSSARACPSPGPELPPTAMHRDEVTHATPVRSPTPGGGPGLDDATASRARPAAAWPVTAAFPAPATPPATTRNPASMVASQRIRFPRLMKTPQPVPAVGSGNQSGRAGRYQTKNQTCQRLVRLARPR